VACRRFTLRLLVPIVVFALIAAACTGGGSGGGGNTSTGKVTITVAVPSDNPGDIQARQKLAAEFMQLHPNVTVKVLVIPADGYDAKILTLIAGGKPPDLFTSGDVQIANIVAKHYAVDITGLAKQTNFDLSVFYPQIIQGLTFGNKLVGLTDNWDTQVMYYNKNLFDAAHVPYPTADWTWADFESAAKKLTSGQGTSKVYGAIFDPWFAPTYSTIWSYGGDVVSADGTTCELNQPPAIQALTFIKGLFDQGISPSPQQMNQQGQGSEQIFLSGRGAMLIGNGRWAAYDLQSVKRFTWAIAPLPKGPNGRANFFHLSMFAIAANSPNQSEAWQFLQLMVSKQGIETTVGNAQGVPSIPSMVQDPAFTGSPIVKGHDTVNPMLESLPTVHRAPGIVNFNQFQDQLDAAWDPMWAGSKTPQSAMDKFCNSIQSVLAGGNAAGG
jgi:multiple sugar transport system substrate-binding protein